MHLHPRPSDSNHIYMVLDFATGGFCQKCYDPECSGEIGELPASDNQQPLASPLSPLPASLLLPLIRIPVRVAAPTALGVEEP